MQGLLKSICSWLAKMYWLRPIETLNTARLINNGFPPVELMFEGDLDPEDWKDARVIALCIAQPMVTWPSEDMGQHDFQQYVLQIEQNLTSSLSGPNCSEIWPILQMVPESIVQAVLEQR